MSRLVALLVLIIAACGKRDEPAPAAGATSVTVAAAACERLAFAMELAVAEASGSAVLTVDGRAVLLVVGDSGTKGAYVLVDAESGLQIERGRLPLGEGAGDDLEGITLDGEAIWGVTSAGWMRRWQRVDGGFELVDGPYAVGPVDESLPLSPPVGGLGAPETKSVACRPMGMNCGKNYEGLCAAPGEPAGVCAGYLASKTDGKLWCLVRDGARLVADPERAIPVADANALTGCDITPDGATLWAGANPFGESAVWRVTGWRDPAAAEVTRVDAFGDGFPESLAVGQGGIVYRLSDSGGGHARSMAGRWRCPP